MPGRGKEGYDLAAKYNLIFRTLCHNMNYFTLWAELDNAEDESTWGFSGCMGKAREWLMTKLVGKGGQMTMIFDVLRRYPKPTCIDTRCTRDRLGLLPRGCSR